MKNRKAIWYVLITFLIGVTLGILINGRITHKKMEHYNHLRSVEGFTHKALKHIDPTEEQLDSILPLVEKYAEVNAQLHEEYREKYGDLRKTYWEELKPLLTKDQKQRIQNMKEKRVERNKIEEERIERFKNKKRKDLEQFHHGARGSRADRPNRNVDENNDSLNSTSRIKLEKRLNEHKESISENLALRLELSDSVSSVLTDNLNKHFDQILVASEKHRHQPDEKQKMIKASRTQLDVEIQKLLSEDQYQTFRQIYKESKDTFRMRNRR